MKKPNGVYMIEFMRDAVVRFMRDLHVRKISGVGKVTEKLLESIGMYEPKKKEKKKGIMKSAYKIERLHKCAACITLALARSPKLFFGESCVPCITYAQ